MSNLYYMPELHCQVMDHQMKEIICICLSKDCTENSLCCLSCIQSLHRGHEVKDFREYINWREKGFVMFNNFQSTVVQLEQSIKYFKELIKENFIDTNQILVQSTTEQINSEVKKINKMIKINSQVNEQLTKSNVNLLQAVQILASKGAPDKIEAVDQEIKFDRHFKSYNLTLQNNQTEAVSYNNDINYCFCQKPILRNSVQIFAFLIENCDEGHIYIGIAHRNLWKMYNEKPSFNECGHGMYLIRNDGYSYSHHQEQMNVKQQTFRFCTKDIITLEVDYKSSKLIWMNIMADQKFTMQFDNRNEMYPVVGLKKSHISIAN